MRDPGADRAGRFGRYWQGRYGAPLLREFVVVAGLYLTYKYARLLTRDQIVEAFANARQVIAAERALGIFTEVDLQRAVLNSRDLTVALNRYYVSVHFPATVALLVWLYICRPRHYPLVRSVLAVTTALALALHMVFPLAPPRMISSVGFVDTLARFGPAVYESRALDGIANQFAAMPSLHFGWALIVAMAVIVSTMSPWRWLIVAHPAATLLAIVATANHYWIDAIAAAGIVCVAWAASAVVIRLGRAPAAAALDREANAVSSAARASS